MTTSILSPFAGDLTGYDLQVIKDFAIEAPWEWQRALRGLIERIEELENEVSGAEDQATSSETELRSLKTAVEEAIKRVRTDFSNTKLSYFELKANVYDALDALESK